jgi:Ca2+-transporting ATPase
MSAFQEFLRRPGPTFRLWLVQKCRIVWRALVKYTETDGEQRAASFAYYAFFAMFPLILLFIALGTSFLGDQDKASATIISYVSKYIPLESQDSQVIISTINGVVKSRKSAGLIAFAVLAWSAMKFFQALVHGVNRAWGTKEYSWWRLPIQNLLMTAILASALLMGSVIPTILDQIEYQYWRHSWEVGLDFIFVKSLFQILRPLIPPLVSFYGFAMFYKFAPRRRTLLREVWGAALFSAASLEILQRLFTLYAKNIGHFNALYGTFGSVVALLLWIYLSGSIIILGGCLSAAKYEIEMSLSDQAEPNRARD